MNGCAAIQQALTGSLGVLKMFVADLDDADLLVRPVPGANHIAWQLGHLILAEGVLVREELPEVQYPAPPAGFAERHAPGTGGNEEKTGWPTKAEYLQLLDKARATTIAAVGKLSDADLDRPTKGRMAAFAPTLGNLLLLVSNHTLMHAGQFSVTRRKLGKPVLF